MHFFLLLVGMVSAILAIIIKIKAGDENIKAKNAAIITAGIVTLVSLIFGFLGLSKENNNLEPLATITTSTTSPTTNQVIEEEDVVEYDQTSTSTSSSTSHVQTIFDSPTDDLDHNEITVTHEEALISTYDGELSEEDDELSYSFVPLRSGIHRFEISGLYEERKVSIYIYDAGNGIVAKREWIGNLDGVTTGDLTPGQDYTVLVKQEEGLSSFTLSICSPAETVSVGNETHINDSIVFTGQENKYHFVPKIDGTYRFEINELYAEKQISMYIFDKGNGTVEKKEWIGNGNGITISSLQPNKPYTIVVKQEAGYSPYVLDIGYPNETKSLSDNGTVNGNLTFTDQVDIFSFIPQKEGIYSFKVSDIQTEKEISMFIVDEGNGVVDRHEWIGNDSGIETNRLQTYKQYYIKIVQVDGFTPYMLSAEYKYSFDE